MNKNQHIPQGYKSSPLGIIPEDWEVKRLGEIANRIGDGIHGTPKYTDKSEYYFINGNNLNNGKIVINDTTKCVPYSEYIKYKKNIPQHTILLSINGTIGNIALYNDEKVMLGKSAAYITIPNYKFFYHLLQSNRVLTAFEKELTGTTIRNLSLDSIRNLTIALPSQREMEAISTLLDLWDTAIEKQTQLVEKLTLRKRGLMQQLLTGKKRLKGFEGEWKEVKLGEVCSMERGEMLTSDNYINGNVPVIAGGKEPAGYHNCANRPCNTITVSCSGASAGYVAFYKQSIFATDCFTISEADKYNVQYIYYMLIDKQERIYQLQTGGAQPHVHPKDLAPMIINLPFIEEQNAIASVLVHADKEIELANKKVTQLQAQKRGLMQVLLTGKKRAK